MAVVDTLAQPAPSRSVPLVVEVREPFPPSAPSSAALFELLEEQDAPTEGRDC
jgi:hypothetical protein